MKAPGERRRRSQGRRETRVGRFWGWRPARPAHRLTVVAGGAVGALACCTRPRPPRRRAPPRSG
eukprot:scaffold8271_cov90-Isochrysis_galbana.AAC.3